ncbi:tubulin-folding cofactor B [Latimeria chalumnae]|uniref:Tubulin folding cofactor B n=1 Tax=Latimeria chalumnae TaxID=7897 RepID=H3AYZ5_LATCH|nr:PREDICTED: tubulin-folding cofactor B [Latimeria chalumnae]|eukprot:XP_006002676.1 PREDICTED: tubulin-folding cofactor B [Latimeria chalumnae]
MEGVTVVSAPTVSVRLTSTLNAFEVQRRFNRGLTIAEFKSKLELIVGTPASCMELTIYSADDKFLLKIDQDDALLGSYPIDDGTRIHVIDKSGAKTGEFDDLSQVKKFEIADVDYDKRADSVRSFLKKSKLGKFNEEEMAQKTVVQDQKEAEEKAAAELISVGVRCEVRVMGQPTRRGMVMYVGLTEFKPGYWVGVKFDEPLGKNDGSVAGKRYFECPPKYGAFLKPQFITVGDFPEEDYGLDDEM